MSEPVVSVKPAVLPDSDLRVRISAPSGGRDLPVVVFSHGFGSSLDGYGPLTDYWAAHGFVVIQPTHGDSRTVGAYTQETWRDRVSDVKRVLDELAFLEAALPGLAGRVDRTRVAAAGHSFGGQTAGNLLGLRVEDEDLSDKRVSAGVLLATAGRGGADLSPFAAEQFPFMNPDFTHMTTPALVVAGDKDDSPLTVRGPDWLTDPYYLSPGEKSLLTVFGAEHSLGGIPGYEAKETTDENPDMVALVQLVTTAYLRHALDVTGTADTDWVNLPENPLGRLESRHDPR
ncbi:alpha/beta hydrolase family protein [Actinophytocola algeriensis]|uniref:Putative dienelactone hydrolase n=1 Tax=Actinophytocola algeriensis TaxID=1768010 RepID=A0A7W7VGK8_9PSEU|nr:alpha/beta fold hydrolase [Actinophytocola algeriensis]MBB4909466.1 putative dienelactone hydrolase [Actinophytocola algeriensis]MBE1475456.1 putative dienelactone hydrolase [Actinophytocola algeriensis]